MSETWTIEYDNDTGPDDESFCEFWTVSSEQNVICKCDSESNAKMICEMREVLERFVLRCELEYRNSRLVDKADLIASAIAILTSARGEK